MNERRCRGVSRILALMCAAACHAALAERSRLDDEVDVVERGDCEIETTWQRRTARGEPPGRESTLGLGCGIGWGSEWAVAFARTHSNGARDEALGIEGKTSLRARAGGRPGWTLAYGADAERPAGGGPWRRSEHFIALEATLQPAAGWLAEVKLGSVRQRSERRDTTRWSLGLERGLSESIEVAAELAGDDRDRPLASVALRYHIWPEHALLSLRYGVKLAPQNERRLGLGVTFEF